MPGRGGRGRGYLGSRGRGGRGRGGGPISTSSRYDDEDDLRRGDRGGGSYLNNPPPRMSSYAEMAANTMPSYSEMASNMPSYASIASDLGVDSIMNSRGGIVSSSDRVGINNRGGSFDYDNEQQLGMKRPRLTLNDSGPPQMMGDNAYNVDSSRGGREQLPLPGPPPDDGQTGGRWGRRQLSDSVPPPTDRMMSSGGLSSRGGSERSLSIHAPPLQDDHQYGRPSSREPTPRGDSSQQRGEPSSWMPPPNDDDEDQFGQPTQQQRAGHHPSSSSQRSSFSSRGGFSRSSFSGLDRRTSVSSAGGSNALHNSGRFQAADNATTHFNVEDSRGPPHHLQHQPPPVSPRLRESSGYSGSIAQRFEVPDRSMNRSPPLPLPPPPMTAPPHNAAPSNHQYSMEHQQQQNSQFGQHYNDTGGDSMMTSNHDDQQHYQQEQYYQHQQQRQQQQRSQTPQPINNNSQFNKNSQQEVDPPANVVPIESTPPSPVCPPSPPPSAPSGYALAVTRMIEMNADMEHAYARLMMLEQEEKRVEARLETLKELQNGGGAGIM